MNMSGTGELDAMRADCRSLAQQIIDTFPDLGMMVATAESCTGGLIAGAITDIAGSSAVFDRGFVTYSNEAKQDMLGVREATLAAFGAVSAQVATEMVLGAKRRSRGGSGRLGHRCSRPRRWLGAKAGRTGLDGTVRPGRPDQRRRIALGSLSGAGT
jgi:hypothetical protein